MADVCPGVRVTIEGMTEPDEAGYRTMYRDSRVHHCDDCAGSSRPQGNVATSAPGSNPAALGHAARLRANVTVPLLDQVPLWNAIHRWSVGTTEEKMQAVVEVHRVIEDLMVRAVLTEEALLAEESPDPLTFVQRGMVDAVRAKGRLSIDETLLLSILDAVAPRGKE